MSDAPRKPLPRISSVTAPFWSAAAERRLRMPRCKACSAFVWPPRPSCGECGDEHFDWTDLSGRGRVYSFTVIRQVVGGPAAKAFEPDIPYVVAWIDLDEGSRFTSNIVGCPVEAVSIGMAVEVTFDQASPEIWLPKFKPV